MCGPFTENSGSVRPVGAEALSTVQAGPRSSAWDGESCKPRDFFSYGLRVARRLNPTVVLGPSDALGRDSVLHRDQIHALPRWQASKRRLEWLLEKSRHVSTNKKDMMTGSSIGIRRFHAVDVPSLFLAARESMTELQQWMAWCRADYSLDDCLDFVSACDEEWEAGRKYSFAIYDRKDGALVGSVGLSGVNHVHRFANVGYWVRSSRTGQGAASAGLRLAARFAFEELHLNRLELIIALGNYASIRVAEKVGAHREGILRDRLLLKGGPESAVIYSLVARDLQPGISRGEDTLPNTCARPDLASALS